MITVAIEKNGFVHVYDGNKQLCCIPLSGGTLLGFTTASVSIKRNSFVHTYDEKGKQISCVPAK